MRPLAHIRDSEICALICEALRRFDCGTEAQAWLDDHHLLAKLGELAADNESALIQLEATRTPAVAIVNHPTLIHYALLANASSDVTESLIRAVQSEVARTYFPVSGLWRAYAAVLMSFIRMEPVNLPTLKPKGYEKFYAPYIAFMVAPSPESRAIARQEIDVSFQQRNKDRRYKDWVGLDGDGEKPVKWDFRLFTLELWANRRR